MTLKLYVVSLSRADERRRWIIGHLSDKNLDFEFIDAIDAVAYESAEILEWIEPERQGWTNFLRPGAVCCALSHISAYKKFLETEDECCLILEDDARLVATGDELRSLLGAIPREALPDIVLLNSYSLKPIHLAKARIPLGGSSRAIYSCGDEVPGSGLAYLLNRRAAEKLSRFNWPVKATADSWDEFAKVLGLSVGVVKPDLFVPFGFASTIDYVPKNGKLTLLRSLAPNWIKAFRRRMFYWEKERNVRR